MIFFACLLAGAIGAAFAAEFDPSRRFNGGTNVAIGLVGGTLAWTTVTELFAINAGLDSFLAILVFGALCGALLTMGLASLRNILRGSQNRRGA